MEMAGNDDTEAIKNDDMHDYKMILAITKRGHISGLSFFFWLHLWFQDYRHLLEQD
jgi:hypothetical protein